MAENQYISQAWLKRQGWTDRAIEIYLSHSDREIRNPYYSRAPPLKLYLKSRVKAVENSLEYWRYLHKTAVSPKGDQKHGLTKKEQLIKEVNSWVIVLRREPSHTIVQSAIHEYNKSHPGGLPSHNITASFLNRITVNYLRHKLTNYDDRLRVLYGKGGKNEAYVLLNKRIYEKISEQYPELSSECHRQLTQKIKGV